MKIITGLDPSLTSFGFARLEGSPRLARLKTGAKRGHERLQLLLSHVDQAAEGADIVALEGLAFGAKGNAVTDLAGLHWLIRHRLWEHKIPYVVIDPRLRMKWITGKGNASKDECLAAVIRRWPMLEITGNDIADAWTLVAMTAAAYGAPLAKMPADRDPLLRSSNPKTGQPKIDWPQLKGTAA